VILTNCTSLIVTDGLTGEIVMVMVSPLLALKAEVNVTAPAMGSVFVLVLVTVCARAGVATTRLNKATAQMFQSHFLIGVISFH
jgi:hypothetical protein